MNDNKILSPTLTQILNFSTPREQEIGKQFSMNITQDLLKLLNLSDDQRGKVMMQLIEIMKKLVKLANNVDRYQIKEAEILAKLKERSKKDNSSVPVIQAESSSELEGIVEDILSQAKSTLDVLVKILDILFGIKLHTYGKYGEKVINALQSNVPNSEKKKVEPLIELIENFMPHSKSIIDMRTGSQHYSSVKMSPMKVYAKNQKKPIVELPKIGNQEVKEYVEITYHNIFCFTRDFLIQTLRTQIFGGMEIGIVDDTHERVKIYGIYIKNIKN